jgi:hypothetical protein
MGQTMPGLYLLSMGFISSVRPYCGIVCNQVTRAPAILLYTYEIPTRYLRDTYESLLRFCPFVILKGCNTRPDPLLIPYAAAHIGNGGTGLAGLSSVSVWM